VDAHALYGRVFAAGYEHWTRAAERAGLRDHRARMLAPVAGDVLEIGPGPGLNLPFYTDVVDSLTLAEPEDPMADRLERRLAGSGRAGRAGRVVRAPAESLPFADASFDYAVATFVLCTVDSPERALAELRRVLRPGGTLVFMEHVRSLDPRLAAWQDRLLPLWVRFAHGCRCNRPTPDTIAAAEGFQVDDVSRGSMPRAVPLIRPLAIGTATAT
jgi:ubiquinone/menaquinone biosynthesis C-methylase UbiE